MNARYLGVDLGGTGTRIVLVDSAGTVLAHRSVPTATDPTRAVDDLTTALNGVASEIPEIPGVPGVPGAGSAEPTLAGVGIGASGPVDATGIVQNPATLPAFTGIDLVGLLRDRLHVPVVIDNDAVTAAYAENRLGAARGVSSVLTVTLGTGVGVAMLTDGHPARTAAGTHPEAGHTSVPGHAPCYCGRTSCWEQQASRSALQIKAAALGLDLDAAAQRARAGDPDTIALFAPYGAAIGHGLADLLTIWSPDLVVLGGGGARFLDLYSTSLAETLADIVDCYRPVAVVAATLGDLAGAIGAALWARTRLGAS